MEFETLLAVVVTSYTVGMILLFCLLFAILTLPSYIDRLTWIPFFAFLSRHISCLDTAPDTSHLSFDTLQQQNASHGPDDTDNATVIHHQFQGPTLPISNDYHRLHRRRSLLGDIKALGHTIGDKMRALGRTIMSIKMKNKASGNGCDCEENAELPIMKEPAYKELLMGKMSSSLAHVDDDKHETASLQLPRLPVPIAAMGRPKSI